MDDLTRRALVAYIRSDGAASGVSEQRSGPVTHQGKTYVVLRPGSGSEVLAVYRYRTTGLLRRLKRWPKAIEPMPPEPREGPAEGRSGPAEGKE
jgi:hypothetical protein